MTLYVAFWSSWCRQRQAGNLSRTGDYYHFSSGDMFRSFDENSDPGRRVQPFLTQGDLVPDDLTMKLFDDAINERIRTGDYNPDIQILLLDGIPRRSSQVGPMGLRVKVDKIIYLHAPTEELERRINGRARIQGRGDDQEIDIVRKRLQTYNNHTLPVLDHYDSKFILTIDSSQKPDAVFAAILAGIK